MDLSYLKADRMPAGVSAAALPSRFDWRERGVITRVQNQGNCGSCYAFAALANLESRIQIDGGGSLDFSENNAKECIWVADSGWQFPDGSYSGSCYGGRYEYVASWLADKGTVLESCDSYQDRDISCDRSCDYKKTLLDWRYINGGNIPDPAVLKAYIQQYGPVFTTLYAGDNDDFQREFQNYDGSYTLYYPCSLDKGITHAVLIVGWDDNLQHSGGRGAWIVKNSWGTDWGGPCGYGDDHGYFTIAYGSANIGVQSSYCLQWMNYDPTGELLFLDDGGWNGAVGYGAGQLTAWGLVKLMPNTRGRVTRLEFWTVDRTTDVDVYIYDNFDGTRLSGLLWQQENLSYGEAGYHSLPVGAYVPATPGNDLIAVVKYTDATSGFPVPFDQRGPHVTGRTFVSRTGADGTWEDQGVAHQWDVGIRLRTTQTGMPATPTPTATWQPFEPRAWVYLPIMLKGLQRVVAVTPTQQGQPTNTPVTPQARTPTPTTPPSGGWVTITQQDFEGAFPGAWRVNIKPGAASGFSWGKRDCQPYGGSYSAWAVGGGTRGSSLACGSNYPDSVYTSLLYGPFSLADATAAELDFHYWLNSEQDYDVLFVGASVDGSNYWGLRDSGGYEQWQEATLDLSDVPTLGDLCGQSRVWVGFIFAVDDNTNSPEGAYVDDIVLRKCAGDGCWDGWSSRPVHRNLGQPMLVNLGP